jgi:hypothetical protein
MNNNLSEKNKAEAKERCKKTGCVKPTKDRFVEYPITAGCGKWYCCMMNDGIAHSVPLHELPSIVGFAGVKFDLGEGLESTWTSSLVYHYEAKAPATPIAARFYVKEVK